MLNQHFIRMNVEGYEEVVEFLSSAGQPWPDSAIRTDLRWLALDWWLHRTGQQLTSPHGFSERKLAARWGVSRTAARKHWKNFRAWVDRDAEWAHHPDAKWAAALSEVDP